VANRVFKIDYSYAANQDAEEATETENNDFYGNSDIDMNDIKF
jgi:hypothetical protein